MADKDKKRGTVSARRDFFRLLLSEAVEGIEKVGHDIVQKRFGHFQRPEPAPYTPPQYDRFLAPQYKIFGPPWPPAFGPYVTLELRRKLQAAAQEKRIEYGRPVPRD